MKFTLQPDDKTELEKLVKSGMTPVSISQRANILLKKADNMSSIAIAEELGINRHTVELWVQKYRNRTDDQDLMTLLNVSDGRGRKEEITGEAKTWLISIACMKPKDLGYAAETWTTSALTKHINKVAKDAGYERLSTITEASVFRILDKANIKPFRIKYYCERRDPEFEDKMHNVLVVYKQLSMQFDADGNLLPFDDEEVTHVLSYDEKPGIQAIANTSEDKLPDAQNGTIQRDYEYKRLGTLSLLAGIDLQTGEAIPLVSDTHNSDDYIEFLKKLDAKYPKGDKIQLILDNLKVHTSQKVVEYLQTIPGRFEFVFTPKHASWLNLVEGFFSKMTKQMLRGIRVNTKQELEERIYKYFDEINEDPVVYHWGWNLEDVDSGETVKAQTLVS
jgi:transposase